MNILILSAASQSEGCKSIAKAAWKKGHKVSIKDPKFLYLLISESLNGYDRIYDGFEKDQKPERLPARAYDCIIPRIGSNLSFGVVVLQHLNNNLKIFATQTPAGILAASNKLLSLQKISQAKIRVPRTVFADRAAHVKWLIEQVGDLPAIGKGLHGSQGNSVYPLIDKCLSNIFLENFYTKKENLLLQKFIDGNSKDIRAIVVDGEIVGAMERTAAKGELRANISKGGTGKKIELSDDEKDIAIRAARAVGLEVAGVDMMKDSSGRLFVIEVNGNYGYGIETITGVDISTPLIEYCERNYKKGNSRNIESTATLLGFPEAVTDELLKMV